MLSSELHHCPSRRRKCEYSFALVRMCPFQPLLLMVAYCASFRSRNQVIQFHAPFPTVHSKSLAHALVASGLSRWSRWPVYFRRHSPPHPTSRFELYPVNFIWKLVTIYKLQSTIESSRNLRDSIRGTLYAPFCGKHAAEFFCIILVAYRRDDGVYWKSVSIGGRVLVIFYRRRADPRHRRASPQRKRNEISETRSGQPCLARYSTDGFARSNRRAGHGGQTNRYSTGFVKSTKLFR